MEVEKKHILKSFKNEQEAIEEVQRIKAEKEFTRTSSISGYNVEKPQNNDPVTKKFSPDSLDRQEPVMEDYSDDSVDEDYTDESVETENPDELANNSVDLERPLPERIINNRIR
ncbi:hypothetical protein V7201_21855 [Bacillus sp. JJ1122]|uniref:hypothetical protein n=1 Tax=Bacillus sp. JJ1122 TaxID=3122951 RepID=UPI002FFDD64F